MGPIGPQGAEGATGPAGPVGVQGPAGIAGAPGLACWDSNGNGIAEASEDINGDGIFDALDCQGSTAGSYYRNSPTKHTFAKKPGGPNSNLRIMRIEEECSNGDVAISAGIQLNGNGRFHVRHISLFPLSTSRWKAVLYNDGPNNSNNQPNARLRLICKTH